MRVPEAEGARLSFMSLRKRSRVPPAATASATAVSFPDASSRP